MPPLAGVLTHGPTEIKIRVAAISQLFDPLDPSPTRERDLDVHTHKFLVGWARELPREAAFTIVVEAPKEEAAKPEALRVGEAFANYFYSCADEEERDLRELYWLEVSFDRLGRARRLPIGQPNTCEAHSAHDGCSGG